MGNLVAAVTCESSSFRQWREVVCDIVVDLDCSRDRVEPFAGRIDSRAMRDMNLLRVTASPHKVARDRRRVARGGQQFILLSHMRMGKGLVLQSGREAILEPGDIAIYDTTSPYEMRLDGAFEMDVLRIDRDIFSRFVGEVSDSTARVVSGRTGTGRICSRLISEIASELYAVDDLSLRQINESLLGLIAMGLQEVRGSLPDPRRTVQQHALIQRAARVVDDELANPDLTCEFVAMQLGVSYRYLLKVFGENGKSLAHMIWEQRLGEARRQLAGSRVVGKPVTTIAYDCGFKDPAHFSRAFRNRFGVSPRQFRNSSS